MGNPIAKQLQFPDGETFDLPGGKSAYELAVDKGYVGTAVKHFDTDFVKMVVSRKIHD